MEYVQHEQRVGRYKVKVIADSDYSLEDSVCDEPVMIFGRDHGNDWQVLDQSKRSFPGFGILRAIEEQDNEELMNLICDCRYSDWEWCNGKVWAEHADWQRGRYFKTIESAARAMFKAEFGAELEDLKVEQFGDYRLTFYLCFWQSELDEYAGVKGAVSCIDSCRDVIDGNVWGFVVSGPYDSDGEESDEFEEYLDSCWGFIGDSKYCLSQGVASAEWLEEEAVKHDAIRFAEDMEQEESK